ncbi:right-handed parallel beta-helix repeat-containing protein [bacterium]|nr:right-handed parallel beta-helix repeat-containing protein [candidate division CSSED10-310 bacterium]
MFERHWISRSMIVVIGALLFAGMAQAATWYVATNGDDTTGDGSPGNPWLTVGYGLSMAMTGDTVHVEPGTYYESQLTIPVGVVLQGSNSAVSKIDSQWNWTVLCSQDSVLENMHIHGNAGPKGEFSRQWYDGCVACDGGNALIRNNFLSSDYSTILTTLNGANPTIVNNTFFAAMQYGLIFIYTRDASTPIIRNNLFNIFVENAGWGYGVYNYDGNPDIAFNNYFNVPTLYNNCTGVNDTTYDPGFYNTSGELDVYHDLYIRETSPVIDIGLNAVTGIGTTDFYGNPRIADGDGDLNAVVDLGALEFFGSPPVIDFDDTYIGTEDVAITFDASGTYDPDGDPMTFHWDWDGDGMFDETTASGMVDHTWADPYCGTIYLRVVDAPGLSSRAEALVLVTVPSPRILHVPAEYGTIQAAIDAAYHGESVEVADGTWTGTGNRNLEFRGKAITLYSENGPDTCIIDCQSAARGFYLHENETNFTVIDGFSAINGNDGAACCSNAGPVFRNCIFRNSNTGGFGGGVQLSGEGDPALYNCVIRNNSAPSTSNGAGGISAGSDGRILLVNCLIHHNSTGDEGGGIAITNCRNHLVLVNSVVANNSAGWQGGITIECGGGGQPSIELFNSIVWGNSGGGAQLAGEAVCSYCCIAGGAAGEGNINLDPAFVNSGGGDYHLQSGISPCIDTGNNLVALLPATDLDGLTRISDGDADSIAVVDMGVYEIQGPPTPTPTATHTPLPTETPEPTFTPTDPPTLTPTLTPTISPTATPTLTPTLTPSLTPTATPTATPTPVFTATPTVPPTPAPVPATGTWSLLLLLLAASVVLAGRPSMRR